jgi:hypothetical protein
MFAGHTFPGVANTPGIMDTSLCGRNITTSLVGTQSVSGIAKLMGGFWSAIAKTSTGAKRSSLDQARIQLLQQLLAAELNASAFGSVPSGGLVKFAVWESAYCGADTKAIASAQAGAGVFNSNGDSTQFTPGTSADSATARALAYLPWWDALP